MSGLIQSSSIALGISTPPPSVAALLAAGAAKSTSFRRQREVKPPGPNPNFTHSQTAQTGKAFLMRRFLGRMGTYTALRLKVDQKMDAGSAVEPSFVCPCRTALGQNRRCMPSVVTTDIQGA